MKAIKSENSLDTLLHDRKKKQGKYAGKLEV